MNNRALKHRSGSERNQDKSVVAAYIGVLAESLHAHLGRGGALRGSGGSLGSLPEKWQRDLVRTAMFCLERLLCIMKYMCTILSRTPLSGRPLPLQELGDATSSQMGPEETRLDTYRRLRERGAHRGFGRGLRGRRSGRLAGAAEREGRLLGGGRGGGGRLLGALSHRLELHR